MEEFLKLDWTPKPEDMLQGRFVDEERLSKESVTAKILLGTFCNPFANIRLKHKDAQKLPKGTSNTKASPKKDASFNINVKN